MKVSHYNQNFRIGFDGRCISINPQGAGNYVLNLVKALLAKKVNCVVFTKEASPSLLHLNNPYLKVVLIPIRSYPTIQQQNHEWEQKKLMPYLEKNCLNLYHATDSAGIPKNIKIPAILTVHDLIPYRIPMADPNQFKYYKLRIETALSLAQKIIAISKSTEKDLERILKVKPSRIKVIYHGISRFKKSSGDSLISLKRKFRIHKDYLIYIGGIARRKNIDKLIIALSLLKPALDFQLVIVGQKNKPLNDELNEIARKNGVHKEIIFTGYLEDRNKNALLENAEMLIYPSSYEGFGLPILEGFQAGVPVITCNVSSMPEIAEKAAYLINPRDSESIAKAIRELSIDEKLKHSLIKKGEIRVQDFSWEKTAQETLSLYQELIKE